MSRKLCVSFLTCIVALGLRPGDTLPASPDSAEGSKRGFLEAKTFFQTNLPYDPRIAIAVDAVVVHRHGDRMSSLKAALGSWKEHGYVVGRMFFADSDATNAYWTGKWDGTPHPDDVERDASGEVVQCAGVRPYMLPTEGWIRYLEEMTLQSIEAGAEAILPEEPLAHAHTGYEKSFQELWIRRYGRPWEAERSSDEARFLTAQLKNELYIELERRLAETTRKEAGKRGDRIPFLLPIHSVYSNVAAGLVAPLGTSLEIPGVDGYVGQVWTGPVNWALGNYDSPERSFFLSAYALYDYFVGLTRGSQKRLWLLSDPVEDDPRHEWVEFERWYRESVVAKLLFPDAFAYEVMPWPDRIFLPGYSTGGGTPAPERNRIAILSAVQVLQEVPEGGVRCVESTGGSTAGVGVALADTLLWERHRGPMLQGVYGLLFPLLHRGVPARVCLAERAGEEGYLDGFRAIVLAYESWKPLDTSWHDSLAAWVNQGGSLVVLGEADDLGGAQLWWRELGQSSPLHHLLASLGMEPGRDGEKRIGKGFVIRRTISPRQFADPKVATDVYLPVVDRALRKAGDPDGLKTPGAFCLRRGPFVVAHAAQSPLSIEGKLVDVFEPELPVLDGVRLAPGSCGLYRDVTEIVSKGEPALLHATHRAGSAKSTHDALRIEVRGPVGTPAVLRILVGDRTPRSVTGVDASGDPVKVEWTQEGPTLRVRVPNDPDGVRLEIQW